MSSNHDVPNIDIFTKHKSEIIKQLELVNLLDGYVYRSTSNMEILGVFYCGENVVTDLNEGYIKLFFNENPNLYRLETEIEKAILVAKEQFSGESLDLFYLEIYPFHESFINELVKKDQRFGMKRYSLKMELNITSNIKESENIHRDYTIEKVTDNDSIHAKEVITCLGKAYLNGLKVMNTKHIDTSKILDKVYKLYTPLISDNRLILVAEKEHEFYGHATVEISENPYFGRVAHLVDIFILETYRNKGVSQELSKKVVEIFAFENIKLLTATVEEEDTVKLEGLLRNLQHHGWEKKSLSYIQYV